MKRTRLRAKRPTKRRSVHPVQPVGITWGKQQRVLRAEYLAGVDLRQLARGRPCMVRLPGCDGGGATTVLAHFRSLSLGSGAGMKPDDWCGAWACGHCHDLVDGRVHAMYMGLRSDGIPRYEHVIGVLRTLAKLIEEGYINVGI